MTSTFARSTAACQTHGTADEGFHERLDGWEGGGDDTNGKFDTIMSCVSDADQRDASCHSSGQSLQVPYQVLTLTALSGVS